jgi:23S rRNA (cytosine1962-C5)-methyltransferase
MKSIKLREKKDKAIRHGHPWIFSGAIAEIKGKPGVGETVEVFAGDGSLLGYAAFSPSSKIQARMWTWDDSENVDESFFGRKIAASVQARINLSMLDDNHSAVRLIHAESDGLPGIIADLYKDVVVVQLLTAGAETWRDTIAAQLLMLEGVKSVYERSDADVRKLEGLPARTGLLVGKPVADQITIIENGLKFIVDVKTGQKTGFYLDQRENRKRLGKIALGKRVLNCFCYTGGFSIYAGKAGASQVVSVDSSGEALSLAKQNASLNLLDPTRMEWVEEDVFTFLRGQRDRGESYDLIVLDPPKFAPTAAQAQQAARGYKDINLLAFKLLKPGGLLFTFSCSGGINVELFQKIVAGAAIDAGIKARIIGTMTQGSDHPIALNFPESAYLKGLICQSL